MVGDILLYVCYHKPYHMLRSDIVRPIIMGKALSDVAPSDAILDDVGDNISAKNSYFCELTATYWIWKNSSADYVGIFQYRRLLNFKNKERRVFKDFHMNFLENFGINSNNIKEIFEEYDVILPQKKKLSESVLYSHYGKKHVIGDLDKAIEIIYKKYPEMGTFAEKMLHEAKRGYFANILVARKDIFDEYAKWLFDILFELENIIQKDVETREPYQQRTYGFIAERLMLVFFEYMKDEKGWKIKEIPELFIEEDKNNWRRYKIRQLKRKILSFFGVKRKRWLEYE